MMISKQTLPALLPRVHGMASDGSFLSATIRWALAAKVAKFKNYGAKNYFDSLELDFVPNS